MAPSEERNFGQVKRNLLLAIAVERQVHIGMVDFALLPAFVVAIRGSKELVVSDCNEHTRKKCAPSFELEGELHVFELRNELDNAAVLVAATIDGPLGCIQEVEFEFMEERVRFRNHVRWVR